MSSPTGTERVVADAASHGLTVDIVERPAADNLEQAADLLGIEPSSVVKSLVVKRHDGSFLFALVPGGRQISWSKLRQAVGVNKLSMPSADIAWQATGFERGTITPLGSSTAWPIFADARIAGRRIALGAGSHGRSAFVDADALVSGYGATLVDITDPSPASDHVAAATDAPASA
jgi:Cys-tRNA(Pro)/Cys-tRNA(Cys) deacylase